MNLNQIHNIYFVGIGGIGMSALARFFASQGFSVFGYDRTETELTKTLTKERISIHFNDDVSAISAELTPENTLVIYTPAVPQHHSELSYFRDNNFTIFKRAEALGFITKKMQTVAVAGTHGKTTTSCLIAHILKDSRLGCNAFLGGIATNYNTNYLENKASQVVVVEADEYDRSFLKLSPNVALITSTDADHLDIYGDSKALMNSFNDFAELASETLIYKKGLNIKTDGLSYAIDDTTADYCATNIRIENHQYTFDVVHHQSTFNNIKCGLAGRHNVENALGAFAVCHQLGLEADVIAAKISSFMGVKRRFEYHIKTDDLVYIDDYAHHPEELKAFINSAKELYPNKNITGVFQPHLYSRTKDFADSFAESLALLDELHLLDIYPARELPIEGITSEWLLGKITLEKKHLTHKNEAVEKITSNKLEVLLTMGAGDIDTLVEPLKKELEKQLTTHV